MQYQQIHFKKSPSRSIPISTWIGDEQVNPTNLTLEKLGIDIVHGCQLRCVGCPNSTLQPRVKTMSAQVFETIFKNIDVKSIALLRLFNFGEPLINKELPRILELIRDSGKQISAVEISTNAQHHDFETLEQAVKTRVLTHFNISCDGDGTPNDYERLRPPSKWSKLILFLEKISEFRARHHPNLVLTTRTICSDPNQQNTWTDILRPYEITPIFRAWHYLPGSTNMTGRDVKPKANVCSFLKTPSRLYIDFDGTVVPCCVHPKAGELGNLMNTEFSKLISDNQYRDFISLMDTNRDKMKICNECEF